MRFASEGGDRGRDLGETGVQVPAGDRRWGVAGEGALGAYVSTLSDTQRQRLEHHLRGAYLTGRPDGERSFVAVALSCRGVVPC